MSVTEEPVVLAGVPYTMIDHVWPRIEHYIVKTLLYSDNKYDLDSIKKCLLERDMQLWIALQGVNILSYTITRIVHYPKQQRLQIAFMGGEHLNKWKHFVEDLMQWARDQGCVAIEASGRPGWERVWAPWGGKKTHTMIKIDL